MKKHLDEEQMLSNKLLADSFSRLSQIQVDTMGKDQIMVLINNQLKLAIDRELLNNEMARLGYERSKIVNEAAGSTDRRILQIIKNLVEAGLLSPDSNSFSFNLNSEQLLVNGKPAPTPDFQKLKVQYIHSPKDHFNYKQHGGSVQVDISMDND